MSDFKKKPSNLRVAKHRESGLSSFVERPVPTEKEVATFERVVRREARDQEIDSNLSEIYQDKAGARIDAQKMNVRKRTPFLWRLFRSLLILGIIVAGLYFAYAYWFNGNSDITAFDLKIMAPDNITAGEQFSYTINYHNPTKYALSQVHLELQYPAGFVFAGASAPATSGNYGWDLPDMDPGANGSLTVTGELISEPDAVNIISGRLSYLPGSLSSQFEKEASASTIVSGPGFTVDLNYSQTAFLKQDNDLTLIFSNVQNNYLGDFNITFSVPAEASAAVVATTTAATATSTANIATTTTKTAVTTIKTAAATINAATINAATTTMAATSTGPIATSSPSFSITKIGGASWQVSGLSPGIDSQEVPLTYRLNKQAADETIMVRLEKKTADGQSYVFWEKSFTPEVVTSGLNLTLTLNGSKNDDAVNFGAPLDYALTYSNLGTNSFKDVIMMAALSGDFLDWSSLQDSKNGQVSNQTIIWTKNEMPDLAEIKPGQTGEIDFSINLLPFHQESDLGKNLTVTAYGQYSVNSQPIKGQDNKSNTINGKINSDLSLSESILYFNSDNTPVGSGPLPPQVGQKTSFKVYWTLTNNLHELSGARAIFSLPSYVSWDEKNATNVGSIYYDAASRQVIWEIGRLPVSVYHATAEFGISITPADSDRNKILVLSPGSTVSALDTETNGTIMKKTGPKTTKLEDDDIAGLNNSGRVQ